MAMTGILQHSELVSVFEGWEERYDGMTGSLFYKSDSGEFYWKPLKSPAPKHEWHKLLGPNEKFVCYYNIITHTIADEVGENAVVHHLRLNDTYLRGCTDITDGRGSIGKCWHTLEHDSILLAESDGWEWRYVMSKKIWYFHRAMFSRYQWSAPDEWAAVRYIRFDEGGDGPHRPEFYDYIEQRMIREGEEEYDDIESLEVVTGNAGVKNDVINQKIQLS